MTHLPECPYACAQGRSRELEKVAQMESLRGPGLIGRIFQANSTAVRWDGIP